MRAIELSEEPERVFDLIDAKVERIDALIGDVDARLLVRSVGSTGGERKARPDRRAGLRACGRRGGRGLRAADLIAQCGARNRRDDDGKIDNNDGELISEFHTIPAENQSRINVMLSSPQRRRERGDIAEEG